MRPSEAQAEECDFERELATKTGTADSLSPKKLSSEKGLGFIGFQVYRVRGLRVSYIKTPRLSSE